MPIRLLRSMNHSGLMQSKCVWRENICQLRVKRAWDVDRILKIITLLDDISQREERVLKDVLKAL